MPFTGSWRTAASTSRCAEPVCARSGAGTPTCWAAAPPDASSYGLAAAEIGADPDLLRLLNHGYLPRIDNAADPRPLLDAYVSQYLMEEVADEGLARRLPAYADFLALAALANAEVVNYSGHGPRHRRQQPDRQGLLPDTRGHSAGGATFLPTVADRNVRTVAAPKFFFLDVGVVNFLANRGQHSGRQRAGRQGIRELGVPRAAPLQLLPLPLRRLLLLAIELRHRGRLRGQRHRLCHGGHGQQFRVASRSTPVAFPELAVDHPETKIRLLVSLDPHDRTTEDAVELQHDSTFVAQLWRGGFF